MCSTGISRITRMSRATTIRSQTSRSGPGTAVWRRACSMARANSWACRSTKTCSAGQMPLPLVRPCGGGEWSTAPGASPQASCTNVTTPAISKPGRKTRLRTAKRRPEHDGRRRGRYQTGAPCGRGARHHARSENVLALARSRLWKLISGTRLSYPCDLEEWLMRRFLLALAIGLTLVALPGVGFAASDEETVRLLQRDAGQGNANAQVRLGYFYENGLGGLAKDTREAARLFQLAADHGNAGAGVSLGYFYEKGLGDLAKDDREAVRLYRLAADQGNAAGQNNLGVLYRDGRGGLTKDEREAARLFKLASDQNNAYGQQNLGIFYRDGRGGLTMDNREAARLFKLAADQGNANARTALNQITQPSQEVGALANASSNQEVVEPSSAPVANLLCAG